jgi:class 3 adenylate cyclase/predicted ATPase
MDRQSVKQEDKDTEVGPSEVERRAPEEIRPFDSSTKLTAQGPQQAERRQLTVMFCDLVGFAALSEEFDPEDLRRIIRDYQDVCSKVASRFEGYIAKYPGDVLLVYFGYPLAHEDDAQRAVKTGLEMIGAIRELPLQNMRLQSPLQARVGIHTGLMVIGEMEEGKMDEPITIVGETPNIAARLLNVAEPDTVLISSATYRLVEGLFECRDLGLHTFKGVSTPLNAYRVLNESGVRSRFEAAVNKGLTPLVGREQEVGILLERWERVKEGMGQVVLVCGEPGIGKSRLVQVLKDRMVEESHTWIESRCSPFYQSSALYPVIDHLQRLLFKREDSPEEKLRKLEGALVGARHALPLQETIPLFASLLCLPLPESYPPLNLSPQRQKQKTMESLLAWLLEEAKKQPVLRIVEDLHWVDPSTLEYLSLLVEQVPTARIFVLLTFRPDFSPQWTSRAHLTQIMLSRLARKEVEVMIDKVAGGKALPAVVVQQLVAKTDGVPLFVEELTKMVLESGLLREQENRYELMVPQFFPLAFPLAIPATLKDSLMARLDRLIAVKEVAQLGATLGREFTYELLQAVSPLDEPTLQRELAKLVEAELLYQRGILPQSRYFFKHALIQDAAYQSLLKSRRQEYHQKIAQVLEKKFPENAQTRPELLAHHYTSASLVKQAIPYWQRAGEVARQRSANVEAIGHLTKGLELLETLPDTPERTQQELNFQTNLAAALMATKGYASPEVERASTRAWELCQQLGETPQLFPVLHGLWRFYLVRPNLQIAREMAEQCLKLAQSVQDPELLLEAHMALGAAFLWLGELVPAKVQTELGIALYDPEQHRSHAFLYYGQDPGVFCLSYGAWALWYLGYPDQALERVYKASTLAQGLSHPYSLGFALRSVGVVHQFRFESQAAKEWAEKLITLSNEQGFAYWLAWGTILRGWAIAMEGEEEGIVGMRQGLDTYQTTRGELARPYFLALLAEAYGKVGQVEEGLTALAEALAVVYKNGERFYEAELYRLKGELLLIQAGRSDSPAAPAGKSMLSEAETCFRQALEVSRLQSTKSLELRAVMSLSRLLQKQDKKEEAQQMLAEIYGWFTEGFKTADLKEAKALLEELT